MKNLKTQFAVLVLSTVCLWTGAFGQLTPSGDSYTNTAAATTNYGAKTLLDVESMQTTFAANGGEGDAETSGKTNSGNLRVLCGSRRRLSSVSRRRTRQLIAES